MSHENSAIVANHVKLLDAVHGAKDPSLATRDKTHECLGMLITFSLKRGVAMTQCDFVKKTWMNFPQDLKRLHRNTPAPYLSFEVGKDRTLLNYARKGTCHTSTAKMLWTSHLSRPDSQLSMGHHCIRVKSLTAQD